MARHTGFTKKQKQALKIFWNRRIVWDADMALHSTIKSGGRADALIEAATIRELTDLITWLNTQKIPWRIIGRGSNILVPGYGFAGVIIKLTGKFESITQKTGASGNNIKKTTIRVGSGCSISKLLSWSIKYSFTGLEFLTGIPGSIGGAINMNAGAFGHCTGEILTSVLFLDVNGRQRQVAARDIHFDYRHINLGSRWSKKYVIIAGHFQLQKGNKNKIKTKCRNIIKQRNRKQPVAVASAGSFFKNPNGDSAGRLIEAAGLKGLRKGDAMVSHKHANFIVNTGNATTADITDLMEEIQHKVFLNSGVRLQPEVHIL